MELMCDLPYSLVEIEHNDSFLDEFLFLISTTNPWYGDLIIYLQTQRFQPNISHDDRHRIHHHAKYYLIINDTLYICGIDSILQRYLTHEETETVVNDCHSGACGGLQRRKSFALGIFGLWSLNIVMKWLINSHPVNTFIRKITPTLLLYTSSLQLALFQMGYRPYAL